MEKAEDLHFFSPYADHNLWTEAGYTSGIRSHCEHRVCCEEPICCLTVCLISQTGNRSSGNMNIYRALIKVTLPSDLVEIILFLNRLNKLSFRAFCQAAVSHLNNVKYIELSVRNPTQLPCRKDA